ncbi:MAG: hypothetical protein WCS43_00070 [Verrucomicrobiota bacterium]
MNHNTDATDEDGLEALENGILDVLRHLPSEQGGPSQETDTAVLRMATSTMARIRRRSAIKRAFVGVGALASCLALALLLLNKQAATPPSQGAAAPTEDSAVIVLREISALFPGQIQSIQRDASGLQLSLADAPTTNPGPAVVLNIGKNGDSREIITFSGQTIEIMGYSLTVHTSKDGRIILKGTDIEWLSDSQKNPLPDLHIRARLI